KRRPLRRAGETAVPAGRAEGGGVAKPFREAGSWVLLPPAGNGGARQRDGGGGRLRRIVAQAASADSAPHLSVPSWPGARPGHPDAYAGCTERLAGSAGQARG